MLGFLKTKFERKNLGLYCILVKLYKSTPEFAALLSLGSVRLAKLLLLIVGKLTLYLARL